MALTLTETLTVPIAPKLKVAIISIAMDASGLEAGETCDLSDYFDTAVYGGFPIEHDADLLYRSTYDLAAAGAPATGKIHTAYYDYDAGADGDAIPIPDTTDLSALDGNWVFLGY